MAWVLSLIISCTAFLLPALWNGFALVFFDTGGYLDRVITMSTYPGRSFFYGFFLWATSFGWWFFWGPIAVQSLLCFWMIHLTLRCHHLPAGPFVTTCFCLGLSLLTGISWYASQLMPDILVPLAILAMGLLGFHWQKLRVFERVGVSVTALLGITSHNSCLALAIGLLLVISMIRSIVNRQHWPVATTVLPPVAVVIAGLLLIPTVNLSVSGRATYASGGPVFLFARFVQAGIAQRWLADHCPVANFKLCKLQKRLPKTSNDFLWARNSPLQDMGGWTGTLANNEFGHVVDESVLDYPNSVIRTSLDAATRQFFMIDTGEGMDCYQDYTRKVFSSLPPPVAGSFNTARQQRNMISQHALNDLNHIHVPVAYLSILGLIIIIVWGIKVSRPDFAGFAAFIFLALLGNAFICGALSSPFNRYQSRVVWLATLVVGMAGLHRWHRHQRQGH